MAWEQGRTWSKGSTRAWRTRRMQVLRRDENLCQIRGPGCLGEATEVDHVVGVQCGGSDDPENLRAVCESCHRELTRQQAAAGRARSGARRPPERHPGLI